VRSKDLGCLKSGIPSSNLIWDLGVCSPFVSTILESVWSVTRENLLPEHKRYHHGTPSKEEENDLHDDDDDDDEATLYECNTTTTHFLTIPDSAWRQLLQPSSLKTISVCNATEWTPRISKLVLTNDVQTFYFFIEFLYTSEYLIRPSNSPYFSRPNKPIGLSSFSQQPTKIYKVLILKFNLIYRIWSSHIGNCEDFYLLGYNAV
jgi:hypothetical protein